MNLEEIYQQTIIEHSRSKKNRRELENPDISEQGHNPSCGDELHIEIKLSDDKQRIEDAAFTGEGCAISQASASMMCDLLRGKTVNEAKALLKKFIAMIRREIKDDSELEALEDAISLKNISNMPARVKCALLAWHTLDEVLK